MVFGASAKLNYVKSIKGITAWTKNQAMEYTSGKMDGSIKEISKTIIVTGMENFTMESNACTGDSGKMGSRHRVRSQWEESHLELAQVSTTVEERETMKL